MPLIRKPVAAAGPHASTAVDIVRALASADAQERWAAARAAGDATDSTEALIAALRIESDSRVREAMLTSLGRINTSESIDAILSLLRSDDASLRTGALDTLREMSIAMREHLPRLLSDADSDVRLLSCEIARALPGPEATRMLCDLLSRESEANVCGTAVDVLAEIGEPEALPVLAACQTRFRDTPFLAFAIKVAIDRIVAQSTLRHV